MNRRSFEADFFKQYFQDKNAEKLQEKIVYLDLLWEDLQIGIKFLAEIGGNRIFFLSLLKYRLKLSFDF